VLPVPVDESTARPDEVGRSIDGDRTSGDEYVADEAPRLRPTCIGPDVGGAPSDTAVIWLAPAVGLRRSHQENHWGYILPYQTACIELVGVMLITVCKILPDV
jgi:hypothetical protein